MEENQRTGSSGTDASSFSLCRRQNIYSSAMAGGVATPPMLIVFHDKYTTLDPQWHIRHLGEIMNFKQLSENYVVPQL